MSVEEYIEEFPEERQKALVRIREMLLKSFPEIQENTQNRMPTYGIDGEVLFSFASQKHYFAFYACHYDLLEQFENITQKYDCGKSCIRFKYCNAEVIKDLKKISSNIYRNVEGSIFYGKYKMK